MDIPEGYELLAGRSRENAIKALATAEERGLDPQRVLTTQEGYLIPLGDGNITLQEVKAEPLIIPDPKKANHEAIDEFAASFAEMEPQREAITYDGIEAADPAKPTRAEKVAHITKVIEQRAAENDAAAEAARNENEED